MHTGFAQSGGVSKVGTAVATYLEIPVGAPAVGMGGAFVSVANDATSLYWNSAGSALLDHNELVVAHTNWIAGTPSIPTTNLALRGWRVSADQNWPLKSPIIFLPQGLAMPSTWEFFVTSG